MILNQFTEQTKKRIGIVVPTLGTRPEFLPECLRSINIDESVFVAIVAPVSLHNELKNLNPSVDLWLDDPGQGPAAAINYGVKELPEAIKFVGWIGDDDVMVEGALAKVSQLLFEDARISAVFGMCHYIDETGVIMFTNKSGFWAKYLLRFGPNLLPQPGSLIRREAWEQAGCLDEALFWTFDLDLFIKLSRVGIVKYIKTPVAKFRWHSGSLTAGSRIGSVKEASKVRVRHLPKIIRPISWFWEPMMRLLILQTGTWVSKSQSN